MATTHRAVLAGLALVALATPIAAYAASSGRAEEKPHAPAAHPTSSPHPATPETSEDAEQAPGTEHAAEASAPGRAHAAAMKAWAHCVAEAASGPKATPAAGPPKLACGDKPMGPGRMKHALSAPSAVHGKAGQHGHGPAGDGGRGH